MFWQLELQKAESQSRGEGSASAVHTCEFLFNTKAYSIVLCIIKTINHTLACSAIHTHLEHFLLTTHSLRHARTETPPVHNADFSFCHTNAAQLGSAQQQQSYALCSFLPSLLVLLNNTSPAHTQTHTHRHKHTPPSLPLHVFSLQIPVFSFADHGSRAL